MLCALAPRVRFRCAPVLLLASVLASSAAAGTFSDVHRAASSAAQVPTGLAAPAAGAAGSGHLVYLGTFTSPLLARPPELPRNVIGTCEEPEVEVKLDPNWNRAAMRPTDLPREANGPLRLMAPQDFTLFRNNQAIGGAVTGAGGVTSTTDEPSLGTERNIVFYTGNWYGAISRDGGIHWSYLDPYATFPAPPGADAGGFCCDQIAYYDPQQDLLVWLLQYSRNAANTHNIQRIAIASGLQASSGNPINWKLFRTAAEDFALPNTGYWVDFPDLAAGSTWLYSTTNLFTTPGNAFAGAVIYRMRLADLAASAGGNIYYEYYRQNIGSSFRMVQGSTNVMYWAGHLNNTTLQLWMWPDVFAPGQIVTGQLTHAGFNLPPMIATGPDGRDFGQGADNRILGAYVLNPDAGAQNTFLGFMFNSAQGNGYNWPYTRIVGDLTSNIYVNGTSVAGAQTSLWNPDFAFLYPTVTPNGRGDLGGLIHEGGGIYQPEARAWIADAGNFGVWESKLLGTSTNGPPPPDANSQYRWGDYVTVRPNWCSNLTWSGGTFIQSGAAGGAVTPIYTWFGRERDTPAADLQAYDVVAPGEAVVAGDAIATGASLINIGAQASAAVQLDFRLSADTLIDVADYPLGIANVNGLNPEAVNVVPFNGTVPANVPAGTYYVGVIASSGAECWLGNNIAWSPEPVTVTAAVAAQLSLFDGAWSDGAVALRYRLLDVHGAQGVNLYRTQDGQAERRLTPAPIPLDGRAEYQFTDTGAQPGASYTYSLGLVQKDGSEERLGSLQVRTGTLAWALGSPAPNPSRGGCSLTLAAPRAATVHVRVLDAGGRLIAVLQDGPLAAGEHRLAWNGSLANGRPAGAGIYFVTGDAPGWSATRRLAIVR